MGEDKGRIKDEVESAAEVKAAPDGKTIINQMMQWMAMNTVDSTMALARGCLLRLTNMMLG